MEPTTRCAHILGPIWYWVWMHRTTRVCPSSMNSPRSQGPLAYVEVFRLERPIAPINGQIKDGKMSQFSTSAIMRSPCKYNENSAASVFGTAEDCCVRLENNAISRR
jgi:hypothetical protein